MIVQIERKTKYYLIFSEMQPIFDLISGSKIQLNEQKAKQLVFFCFFECEYFRDIVSKIVKNFDLEKRIRGRAFGVSDSIAPLLAQ